jgi:hypothetical protein
MSANNKAICYYLRKDEMFIPMQFIKKGDGAKMGVISWAFVSE